VHVPLFSSIRATCPTYLILPDKDSRYGVKEASSYNVDNYLYSQFCIKMAKLILYSIALACFLDHELLWIETCRNFRCDIIIKILGTIMCLVLFECCELVNNSQFVIWGVTLFESDKGSRVVLNFENHLKATWRHASKDSDLHSHDNFKY
jgi:hypothetical protein